MLECDKTAKVPTPTVNKKAVLLDELRRAHLMAAKALEKLIALEN